MTLWSYIRSTDISYLRNTIMALFTVDYDYGQEVYSAPSKEALLEYLKEKRSYFVICCDDNEDVMNQSIEEVELDTKTPIQLLGGYVE